MSRLRLAAAAAALAVAGCAMLEPRGEDAARKPATPFDLSGRVVVSYDGGAFSSGLRWEHGSQRDEMWLLTPLGQALAHIVNEENGATFTAADQKQYRAASVENLTRQALGWELPLARLQFWVRGEIAPGSPPTAVERDAEERLTMLEQDGWRVSFVHYPRDEHGGLPRSLALAQGSQRMRLVIDGWRTEALTR